MLLWYVNKNSYTIYHTVPSKMTYNDPNPHFNGTPLLQVKSLGRYGHGYY